ncbi:MAG: ATP/GTP-binding protein, partial [Actinomycetota bacterium]
SEIDPLRTEAAITSASSGVDDTSKVSQKTTTTVAMDFGRITIDNDLVLYLFGTPGQERFGFMWDDLVTGALGAVVLVDSRRLADCFYAVDYFEQRNIPFVVGVNTFDGKEDHALDDIAKALQLSPEVLVRYCDARDRNSVKSILLALFEVILSRMMERQGAATAG